MNLTFCDSPHSIDSHNSIPFLIDSFKYEVVWKISNWAINVCFFLFVFFFKRVGAKETDYTVWVDLSTSLSLIESVWLEEPNHAKLLNYLRILFTDIANKLGWEPKGKLSKLSSQLFFFFF